MKEKRDKISPAVLYSPFMLMLLLLLIVSGTNFAYNIVELNANMEFQTALIKQLLEHGMSQELVDKMLNAQNQHLIENAQKRMFYGVGVVAFSIFLAAVFIYVIFRNIIKKTLSYQDD